jgi:hypothetical protein
MGCIWFLQVRCEAGFLPEPTTHLLCQRRCPKGPRTPSFLDGARLLVARAKKDTVAEAPGNPETLRWFSPFGNVPDSGELRGRLDFVADLTVARRIYGARCWGCWGCFSPGRRGGLFLPEGHPRNALFLTVPWFVGARIGDAGCSRTVSPYGQSSVRKGEAGRFAPLERLHSGASRHA